MSYTYDNLGRLVSTMIGPANAPTSVTNYTYNQLGQLWKVTVVEQNGVTLLTPEVTSYEYNLMGNLIQQNDPNGVIDQYTYDNMNRLVKETETGPGNTPIAEYDYTYRPDDLKAMETDDFWFQNNGQNVEVTNRILYSYDALDRLTDEAFSTTAEQILGYDSTLPSNVQQWETFNDDYFYDLDSNMVGEVTTEQDSNTTQTTASTYDANDRLVEQVATTTGGTSGSSSTTTEYTYNDTEQTSETVISGTPSSPGTIHSSQEYQYNVQGQTSGATVTTYTSGQVSQVEQQTYGYDTDGNRVSVLDQIGSSAGSWTSQTLTEYLNDSNNPTGYTQVLAVLQSDATSGHTQQATQEAIGLQPISQTVTPYTNGEPGTPTTLYFGYDGQGSVRVLTNSAGAVATAGGARQVFNYDAYGNAVGFSISAAATTLLYDGQQTDAATGLQDLRARYYNPATASFTSFDSFSGSLTNPLGYNKYLFTQANPVNGTDPTGHEEAEDTEEAVSIGESADATSAGASMSAGNGAVARLLTGVAEFDLYAIQYAGAELLQAATPFLTLIMVGQLVVDPASRDTFISTGGNPAALSAEIVAAPALLARDVQSILMVGENVAMESTALKGAASEISELVPVPRVRNFTTNTSIYRKNFFTANPQLINQKIVVHHAIEQDVLETFPGIVSEEYMHSAANLRGVPAEINGTVHLSQIRTAWDDFYAPFIAGGTVPTVEQLAAQATEIDETFGFFFNPPRGGGWIY